MAGTIMRSTQFRAVVEPIFNQSFDGVYDQRTDEYKQIFSEENGIKRAYHEEPVLYGFGAAPKVPDGQPVVYDEGGQLFTKRYDYDVYGLAFALTKVLVEKDQIGTEKKWRRIATYSLAAFGLMLIGHFIFSYLPLQEMASDTAAWYRTLDPNFHWMVLAGFLAQMVDGATSMGYGVTSSIVLQSANVSPAAISAGIHTAEMFTSGASGYSHYKFGNVNKKLFKALVIPGIIGAILGALLLVWFDDTHIKYLRPVMAAYTLFLGIRIFSNAFRKTQKEKKKFTRYGWLAGAGGFLDSFGGGGWGPLVTSTLITKGRTPRYVVGSVSLTEFFVTLSSAFTFFALIGVQNWQIILALVVGGVIAAPIAARLAGKLPRKASFILLGTVVILWSFRILSRLL